MKRQILKNFSIVAGLLLLNFIITIGPEWDNSNEHFVYYVNGIITSKVNAADYKTDKHPYGGSQSGTYGAKKEVDTIDDAQKALNKYFSKRDVKIGGIREKKFYFEAEILDKKDNLIDKVIIDKRTGRIRSIY